MRKKKSHKIGDVISVAFLFFILGFGIGLVVNPDVYIPDAVNIPDAEQVNAFCKLRGFDAGWLDGYCGANMVKCSKLIADNLYEFKCVEWRIYE